MCEKIAVEEFRVEEIPLGTKGRFHLVIDNMPDGGDLLFPALIVRGRRPGKTLLATGGTHGDEYEGVVAIQDVFEGLDPSVMEGTFFGIPVLNAPAFIAAQREGVWDHLNLARVFPGSSTGSPTQRIAHAFQEFVVDQADLYLDIHSAGSQYVIQDFAGYQIREGDLGEIQREAAFAFGFDLVWATAPSSGRTLNAAADKGVPSIYVEMRGSGQCRPEDLEKARSGIKNVLSFLGIVEGPFPRDPPRLFVEDPSPGSGHLQTGHPSPTSGIFVSSVGLWDPVSKGQKLGEIRRPDGTPLARVESMLGGRVLCLRVRPRVFSGDFLAFVLEGVD